MSRTDDRSVSLPVLTMSRMMPGCGNSAMSGNWLPRTRVLISALKSEVGDHLIVMPCDLAYGSTDFSKFVACGPVKAIMISMFLPVFLLPPEPEFPPELRQPAVTSTAAPAATAALIQESRRIDTPIAYMRPEPPSRAA